MTVVARTLQQLPDATYPPDDKVVALTFDEAPGAGTARVLDALATCGAPATFFVTGEHAAAAPGITRRIVDAGHAIGNRGWSRTRLEELTDREVTEQFARTDARMCEITGARPRVARPPHTMAQAARLAALVAPLGYAAVVGWSMDPGDAPGRDAAAITDHVVEALHSGSIVRLRTGAAVAVAIPRIVTAGRVLGYRFVTA
jgi:peptidoglycan-N-acetylglucosamine deacetylase